jgi:signal recognition particle subunit SRP72
MEAGRQGGRERSRGRADPGQRPAQSQASGAAEEEVEDGRIAFNVQRSYVRQRLGQSDAALEGYEAALRQRPTDAEVAAVASNNLFALRGREQSLFDSAKKARALNLEEGVESKLTVNQRRVFALNRCLLALYTNATKECGRALAKLEKEFEGSELPTLVRAALLARERRMEECRALLQAHAAEHPKTAALVQLTLAQLQVNEGDRAGAARTLESVDGAHRLLGVVGSIVRLCEGAAPGSGAPRPAEALEAALRAAEADGAGRDAVRRLVLLAAEAHARAGGAARAAEMLEKLVKGGDRDPALVARLVSAMAEVSLERAEEHARLLPALDAAEDVDVQELEAGPAARAGGAAEGAGGAAAEGGGEGERKKALRRRRRKLQRAVVAAADGREVVLEARILPRKHAELVEMGSWGRPDPERWLPWHQRSYNRKLLKKRKGLGTASGGAQGGAPAAAAAAALDRSEKFAAQIAAQQQAAAAGPAAAAAASPAAAAGKTYKKKGKK